MSAEKPLRYHRRAAALTTDVDERTEETTEDGLAPIVIASIMYCPAIIAASYGFSC